MKKLNYVLVAFLFAGTLACTKESIKEETNLLSETYKTKSLGGGVYEEFGIDHNAILEGVGLGGDLAVLNSEERYDILTEVILTEDPEFIMDFETCNEHITFTNALTSINAANEIIEMGELTENVREAITLLFSIIEDVNTENEGGLLTPDDFNIRINELEDFIETNCVVDYNEELKMGNDGALILGTCTIAKYSYDYWYNSIFTEDHSWHGLFLTFVEEEDLDIVAARAPWIKRAWADATNFFTFEERRNYTTTDNLGQTIHHVGFSFSWSKKRASEASSNA